MKSKGKEFKLFRKIWDSEASVYRQHGMFADIMSDSFVKCAFIILFKHKSAEDVRMFLSEMITDTNKLKRQIKLSNAIFNF